MLDKQQQKILTNHLLFADFNLDEIEKISTKSNFLVLENQQHLFKQNDLAKDFFLLVKGSVKLSFSSPQGDERVINIVDPGNTFAEAIMFLDTKNYPINASAIGESQVLRINAKNYLHILEHSPAMCFNIMGKLSQRLHWLINEINNISLHDGTYRLVNFLLNNIDQKNKQTHNVYLLAPKHVLASRLSIKPETLSRILKKLSEESLLEVHKNHITLLKLDALKCLIST